MALRGATLSIGAGERLLLQGPNGSGKSTLLRVLTGEQPVPGRHGDGRRHRADRAAGRRPAQLVRRRNVGIADQHARRALLPEWNVLDNIALQLRVGGLAAASARQSRRRRWTSSAWRRWPTGRSRRCPAARRSGSRSARRWPTGRGCCSPTSRPANSTTRPPTRSTGCWLARRNGSAPASCWSATTVAPSGSPSARCGCGRPDRRGSGLPAARRSRWWTRPAGCGCR